MLARHSLGLQLASRVDEPLCRVAQCLEVQVALFVPTTWRHDEMQEPDANNHSRHDTRILTTTFSQLPGSQRCGSGREGSLLRACLQASAISCGSGSASTLRRLNGTLRRACGERA